ncbi:MAG TPA: hypothetical protein VES67_14305 [Vicinamibacterales bacterium]|nr:hypothetical protein [Vicinamibacterales bacterium]
MKSSRFPIGRLALVVLFPAIVSLTSCERTKTSNPLSPQVAGPMEGVTITTPLVSEPRVGLRIKDAEQPVTLVLFNPVSNIGRPMTLTVQVAADTSFAGQVFTQNGITVSDNGLTRFLLPGKLPTGRTYYWRAKADDGANTSGWSPVWHFDALPPIVIGTPEPKFPTANERVGNNAPELSAANAPASGPINSLSYNFQVSERPDFVTILFNAEIPPGGGETKYEMPTLPGWDRTFYWRVRVWDPEFTGSWSRVETFRSPLPPVSAPRPGPPIGGGPVGNWEQCGSLAGNKDALVQCVHGAVNPGRTVEDAFEVTKRVAWLLRGEGAGLLIKNGGENIVSWQGRSFAAGRICYPDGHIYKVLSDIPGTNGPSWQDNDFVDRSLYVPAIHPG